MQETDSLSIIRQIVYSDLSLPHTVALVMLAVGPPSCDAANADPAQNQEPRPRT